MPQNPGDQPSSRKEETPEGPQDRSPSEMRGADPQSEQGPEGKPKGNREGSPDASKDATQDDGATGDPLHAVDGGDQWGNLPVHLRDLFRAEGGRELPPRYRDWIDSYYRRLNKRASD